jgi:hypothetical protein
MMTMLIYLFHKSTLFLFTSKVDQMNMVVSPLIIVFNFMMVGSLVLEVPLMHFTNYCFVTVI